MLTLSEFIFLSFLSDKTEGPRDRAAVFTFSGSHFNYNKQKKKFLFLNVVIVVHKTDELFIIWQL